jgi:hypothetical protein
VLLEQAVEDDHRVAQGARYDEAEEPDGAGLPEAILPARVADFGCGAGWASIELARAFPHIRVDGIDSDDLAEDLGFDAFFVGDHPAWALDPWLHLAALAVTTERIRLGVNVCCALYRHPVLTARLAADLDNLSNGRLILGLGNGWDANEFANLGLPFLPARDRRPRSQRRSK